MLVRIRDTFLFKVFLYDVWSSGECQLEVSNSHPLLRRSWSETVFQFLLQVKQPQHLPEKVNTWMLWWPQLKFWKCFSNSTANLLCVACTVLANCTRLPLPLKSLRWSFEEKCCIFHSKPFHERIILITALSFPCNSRLRPSNMLVSLVKNIQIQQPQNII